MTNNALLSVLKELRTATEVLVNGDKALAEVDSAMTTIKASCPSCGDVELTPTQVRLVVCSVKLWSYYAFMCTTCQDEVRKPAGRDVVALLISGGVVAEPWNVPAEALEEHAGPNLSYDDVLDFALWLDQADMLAAAAAAQGPRHRRATTAPENAA